MDSPKTLLNYWGLNDIAFEQQQLDHFFKKALDRILTLFDECNIKATFFLIADDIKHSETGRELTLKAHAQGHEIANHTTTHPLKLSTLNNTDIKHEILNCSDLIKSITGESPKGFRAPGYDISNNTIDILEALYFTYDSSAFWSLLNPAFKYYHKFFSNSNVESGGFGQATSQLSRTPYYPNKKNLYATGNPRKLIEIPLPRTVLGLPFYSNFHLTTPPLIRNYFTRYRHPRFLTYLFHLIEFVDQTDNIPSQLLRHPNLKTPIKIKMKVLKKIILALANDYQTIRSDQLCASINIAKSCRTGDHALAVDR